MDWFKNKYNSVNDKFIKFENKTKNKYNSFKDTLKDNIIKYEKNAEKNQLEKTKNKLNYLNDLYDKNGIITINYLSKQLRDIDGKIDLLIQNQKNNNENADGNRVDDENGVVDENADEKAVAYGNANGTVGGKKYSNRKRTIKKDNKIIRRKKYKKTGKKLVKNW